MHGKGFVEGVEYAQEPRQQALLLALMDNLDHEMDQEALKTACALPEQRFKSSKVFDRIPMVYTTFVRYLSLDGRYLSLIPQQDRSWMH